MNHLTALLLGFCIDLLLGDPRWLYHPVQAIGWLIVKLEPPLRRAFPDSDRGQVRAGVALVILVVGITGLVSGGVLWGLHLLHPMAGFAGESPYPADAPVRYGEDAVLGADGVWRIEIVV